MAAHYQGGAVLILGIVICLLAARRTMGAQKPVTLTSTNKTAAEFHEECRAGFKGV